MDRGRIGGGLRRERRRGTLLADAGRLELLDLIALNELLCRTGHDPFATPPRRAAGALDQVAVGRELARRTGDLRRLADAYEAAASAAAAAGPERRLYAAARLQYAQCALTAGDVFGDADAPREAASALADAERALDCQPGRLGGPGLIRIRLASRRALRAASLDETLAAAALFDEAAGVLEARLRATGAGEPEWSAALCEKAELMVGVGSVRKDAGLLDRAGRDMAALGTRLDPDRLPLSWMRARTLQGSALRALGEITGEARLLKDAAVAFGAAFEGVPAGHSPLDRARAAHGLGLALQDLAEVTGEMAAYRSAQTAFDRALEALSGAAETPFASTLAYDRAICLARRAERSGDAKTLAEAEAVFRDDLAGRAAHRDPVGWAVVQLALARVYQARAAMSGPDADRAPAALALSEALDVFTEHGQTTLAETALAALRRVQGA